jgi:hypothetical protein
MSPTPEEQAKTVRMQETAKALANLMDGVVLICSTPTAVAGVPRRLVFAKAALEIAQLRDLLSELELTLDVAMQKQGKEPGTFVAAVREYHRKVQEETK